MGKIITAYGGFTATDIKNRAEIPAQADMVVTGNNVDCSNISVSLVKNVLGESSTAVGGLCTSPLVNTWSGFAPTEWYVSGVSLLNRVKTPYSMGSFAGYNHNAIVPGFMGGSHMTTFKYVAGDSTQYTIAAGLQVGEINFPAMLSSNYVKLVVKENGNSVGTGGLVAIGTTYNGTTPINPYCTVNAGSHTGTITYTAYVFLSNGNGDEICQYPNVAPWTITASQKSTPTQGAGVMPSPSDTTIIKIVAGTATMDLSGNYTISISNITKWNMTPYTGLINIKSELYNEVGTLIATNNSIVTNSSLRSFSGNIGHATDYDYITKFIVTGY